MNTPEVPNLYEPIVREDASDTAEEQPNEQYPFDQLLGNDEDNDNVVYIHMGG